ncbi:MAG: amino acid ABC transporter substrate-binding protein [Calothrix sp. C42_A2020_038]|nr:amino acid ABC transporter substrate-binding protein [Calothrix sp. C42_A2020_038]
MHKYKSLLVSTVTVFSLAMSASFAYPVHAETVMQKVKRTGVLTAGTSKDAIPFAYVNSKGQSVGYSIDMLVMIKEQLEKEFGKKIQLKLVKLSPAERIPQVRERKVDIVCDASSFTWERDRQVDFSVSYAVTGTQLLVKKDSTLGTPESLLGKRVGVLPQTTNEQVIRKVQPKTQLVYFKNRNEAYNALQQGKIHAFASDGILSEGWLQLQKNHDAFKIVPDRPFSREGIACMVPENNSRFLDSVNFALIKFMQGFVNGNPRNIEIFDRSFGAKGTIFLNQDLRDLAIETMQLVIESRQEIPENDL